MLLFFFEPPNLAAYVKYHKFVPLRFFLHEPGKPQGDALFALRASAQHHNFHTLLTPCRLLTSLFEPSFTGFSPCIPCSQSFFLWTPRPSSTFCFSYFLAFLTAPPYGFPGFPECCHTYPLQHRSGRLIIFFGFRDDRGDILLLESPG